MNRLKNTTGADAVSRRRDPRIDRTRGEFRAALIRLVGTRSLDDISIREIVEEAASSNATFFRHYKSKASLLDDVMEHFLNDISTPALKLFASADIEQGSVALCEKILDNRETARFLLSGKSSGIVHQIFKDKAVQWSLDPKMSPDTALQKDLAVTHLIGSSIGIIAWWLESSPMMSKADVAKLIETLVLRPVFAYRGS